MAADGHLFGGAISDYVIAVGSGDALLLAANAPVWFYNARIGGTRYETGLTDINGGTITEVMSDSAGAIPQFRGPTGIRTMWADASAGAGPRRLMVAVDLSDEVAELVAQVATLEATLAELSSAPAWVRRDPATGAWPARPETGRWVIWVDTLPLTPSPPAIGGTGMVDGLDMYWGGA
ncbi:hypothetical protein AB0K34_04855 [Actinomadura sp. NPDC049382]|uniref:hypothetical protein n=1 Tax=Actinomadura sp. NPDC049382 TaxID=3158220 RepID=UPI0034179B82